MNEKIVEKSAEIKPLVTFVLLTYNHSKYVADAVHGALAQTYAHLQIIISDDASNDDTYQKICEIILDYDGPHEIITNQNKNNLGIGAHINVLMSMSDGDYIVAAAGDDISKSDRVEELISEFSKLGDSAYSIWSDAQYIDSAGLKVDGEVTSMTGDVTDKNIMNDEIRIVGATHAWRREVFEFFGPLMSDVCFEDHAIAFRSHLLGSVRYLDKKLVCYRIHENSLTNFGKIDNLNTLYSAAEKRSKWMVASIFQRKKDLERASRNILNFNKNYEFMRNQLNKREKLFERRRIIYEAFPSISWHLIVSSFLDVEICKVFIRTLIFQLNCRRKR